MSPRTSLTLDKKEREDLFKVVGELILNHFETLPGQKLTRPSDLVSLQNALMEKAPRQGQDPKEVLSFFEKEVLEVMTHLDHPKNFAFVPSPSNFVSAMADALASSFNVFSGGFVGPSGVAQIENVCIQWVRDIFGFPKEAAGLFVSGGSMANLTALAVARQIKLANNTQHATVYFSDQTHFSVPKDLKILGFQKFQIRKVGSDLKGRLNHVELKERVYADRSQGLVPFCVVANAGTTSTGAVDDLSIISDFCQEEGLWLHVDAAYGGGAILCEEGRSILKGVEKADSVATDPHKWMFQPYEIGCVLIRNADHLKDTFKTSAEYIQLMEHGQSQVNYCDYGVQLSRGFRAFKFWFSVKTFGLDAFESSVKRGLQIAKIFEKRLIESGKFEIITPAHLAILTFCPLNCSEQKLDEIVKKILVDGFMLLSPTRVKGRLALRLCTINPRLSDEEVHVCVDYLSSFCQN